MDNAGSMGQSSQGNRTGLIQRERSGERGLRGWPQKGWKPQGGSGKQAEAQIGQNIAADHNAAPFGAAACGTGARQRSLLEAHDSNDIQWGSLHVPGARVCSGY